ncbi:hypothetical protein DMH17_16455 [Raoultella planticola]|nr:hypothetical protein [Raoultella planticola]
MFFRPDSVAGRSGCGFQFIEHSGFLLPRSVSRCRNAGGATLTRPTVGALFLAGGAALTGPRLVTLFTVAALRLIHYGWCVVRTAALRS